jgi:hypothetical protein
VKAKKIANYYFQSVWIILAIVSISAFAEESELPVVKLSPQIRYAEPVEQEVLQISCERLRSVVPGSNQQARLLRQRRQQCLEQFQQFIPNKDLR